MYKWYHTKSCKTSHLLKCFLQNIFRRLQVFAGNCMPILLKYPEQISCNTTTETFGEAMFSSKRPLKNLLHPLQFRTHNLCLHKICHLQVRENRRLFCSVDKQLATQWKCRNKTRTWSYIL